MNIRKGIDDIFDRKVSFNIQVRFMCSKWLGYYEGNEGKEFQEKGNYFYFFSSF